MPAKLREQSFPLTDIDECAVDPTPCGIAQCWNNVGSYVCICPKGYYWDRHSRKCKGKELIDKSKYIFG